MKFFVYGLSISILGAIATAILWYFDSGDTSWNILVVSSLIGASLAVTGLSTLDGEARNAKKAHQAEIVEADKLEAEEAAALKVAMSESVGVENLRL